MIRQRGGNCDNPTPLAFSRFFKQISCQSLLSPVAAANCELDSDLLLQSVVSISPVNKPVFALTETADSKSREMPLLAMECANDSNGLFYVAGFLLCKILTWHSCQLCRMLSLSWHTLLMYAQGQGQRSRDTYTFVILRKRTSIMVKPGNCP